MENKSEEDLNTQPFLGCAKNTYGSCRSMFHSFILSLKTFHHRAVFILQLLEFSYMTILRNMILKKFLRNMIIVLFSEVLGLFHNSHVVQKLNWVYVSFFEDEEGIDMGLVLTLLL